MPKESINFRTHCFNEEVDQKIKTIYDNIHQHKAFSENLTTLYRQLQNYYTKDRQKDYKKEKAVIRANEVQSEFLQNLIYYISRNIKDQKSASDQCLAVLEWKPQEEKAEQAFSIFYRNNRDVTIWVDPKERYNALNAACKESHSEVVQQLLAQALQVFRGDAAGLKAFLTHLLALAEKVFAKDDVGLKAFLTNKNKDGFSALNSAAYAGHCEVVQSLLVLAEVIFGSKNSKEFKAFLEQQDKYGFTPLNTAAKTGKKDVVALLIKYGADPDIKNNARYSARDNAQVNRDIIGLLPRKSNSNPKAAAKGCYSSSSNFYAKSSSNTKGTKRKNENPAGRGGDKTASVPVPPLFLLAPVSVPVFVPAPTPVILLLQSYDGSKRQKL
jgi:hypothetical protein